MNHKWVITIGREFCTGGADTAKLLAQELGYDYLDKELIDETAELLAITTEAVRNNDERPESYWDIPPHWYMDVDDPVVLLSDAAKIADAQAEVIRRHAADGSCVIVGRCADYTMREYPYLLRVFFYADWQTRIETAMEKYDINEFKAEKLLRRSDKLRSTYYNRNTRKRRWGAPNSYDMFLDLGKLGPEGAIALIREELEKRDSEE